MNPDNGTLLWLGGDPTAGVSVTALGEFFGGSLIEDTGSSEGADDEV